MVRRTLIAILCLGAAALAAAPPSADAQQRGSRTGVETGSATGIQPGAATVRGAVRPNGVATTFSFQYGTTRRYEATTPEFDAGDGRKRRSVRTALLNLAPYTTYNYRIVARNERGVFRGRNRTFRTRKQPLGLVLNADANPVAIDQPLTLSGALAGTDNDNRRLTLQAKPFPYTMDWGPIPGINDLVTETDQGGAFAFRLPALAFNTQFRVVVAGREIASPILAIGVMPRVSTSVPTRVTKRRGKRRARVAWRGTITPVRDGSQVLIQKRLRGDWRTIGATVARTLSATQSRYRTSVRQRRGGTYRVVVNPVDGAFVPSAGREHRIAVRKRR